MTARPEKRAAIVAAARDVFLESGFPAASMDTIASRAGVSKQTVYNHFGSKDELFGAIIRGRCQELLEALQPEQTASGRPETVLYRLAQAFVDKMLAPDALALYRTLVVESQRSPELREIYYRSGPDFAVETLSAYLREQTRRGVLRVTQPRIAAEQFFAMLGGHLQIRALLGLDPTPPAEKIKAYVDNAVAMFLRAVRAV
ncbi:MAG TPA: TetR/AcrR family transcriptional regulator [Gammaproteobacteria bacterium]|jgi:AcrR family transcriptional regulator|nr:TetR/AcrR family transcriptional regulator [Gammaproteobacteria bacterium]